MSIRIAPEVTATWSNTGIGPIYIHNFDEDQDSTTLFIGNSSDDVVALAAVDTINTFFNCIDAMSATELRDLAKILQKELLKKQ